MKKILLLCLAFALCFCLLAACGSDTASLADSDTIVVGASVTPHAVILSQVVDAMAEKGYTLQIEEFNDYVLPNTATESGEIGANFFQHYQYLDDFNAENDTHLVAVAAIHYEPFGIYAGKTASIEDLAEGATIAVPNDGTNEARALLLLEQQGLITLKEDASMTTATKIDIEENPLGLDIQEVEAAQLPRSLADVDLAVINGNYAIQAGLNAAEDALAIEDKDSEAIRSLYANVLVVKEGNEEAPVVQALIECLQSEEVRASMEEEFGGAVIPMF